MVRVTFEAKPRASLTNPRANNQTCDPAGSYLNANIWHGKKVKI